MQTHVSSTRTVTGSHGQLVKALGGTALAVAVAAGVVLWRGAGQQDERTAPAVASLQAEPVAVEHTASVFGTSATPAQVQSAALGQGPIIYIAGSEEQAAYLRQFTAEINALAVAAGRPANSVTVVMAGSEEETQLQTRIAQIREVQQSIGLPLSQVFDLRAG